ncbi:MAG: hypothetical protein JW958_06400 [Candidatus Eisenbacteria bacterium]|nr:hypothetical protein [Candidatus Eisenbacteria bacterium]
MAALLFAALFAALPGPVLAAPDEEPETQVLAGVSLENLSPEERERIVLAARKLIRIHGTVGDPSRGEVRSYLDAVEELARFLKRETIETRRRLLQEARALFEMVDRRWIDNAFQASRNDNAPMPQAASPKLADQTILLRRIGELLKEEQAIPARQKALEAGADRRYRNLLRLTEEGRSVFESIDHPGARVALLPFADDLSRQFEQEVRPAHERQLDLLMLYRKVLQSDGADRRDVFLREYRTYASKVRVLAQRIAATNSGDGD